MRVLLLCFLCSSLLCTHTSFDNIDDIVAQLLTFVDEVHIHRTDRVGVLMLVPIASDLRLQLIADVVDVLRLQLVAEVVDFVFDVE